MKTLKRILWFVYGVVCIGLVTVIFYLGLNILFNFNPIAVVVCLIVYVPFLLAVVDDITEYRFDLENRVLNF